MDTSMYMVVGFEVAACSIERTPGQVPKDVSCQEFAGDRPPKSQEIKKGACKHFDHMVPTKMQGVDSL